LIYTITLNPALDISCSVDQVIPDEKSYVSDEIHHPGGNGINAAIIIHRLGGEVIATGFLGGAYGEEIKKLLNQERLEHNFLPISGNTRMNLTISNRKTHKQMRLCFQGPRIKSSEFKEICFFLDKIDSHDIVLIGGSLPPGISPDLVEKLVRKLKKKHIFCMVDMPGKALNKVLSAKPDFIKPNLIEFQELVGKKVESIKSILPLVRKLNKLVPLICVSSIDGGAILVTRDEAWFGKIPNVKIKSAVGAGDSMVGAMAAQLANDPACGIDELLRMGLAAACATLIEDGLVLGSKQAIARYQPKIVIKEIK
jgi:1-phosphofructokinase family hexose kinase